MYGYTHDGKYLLEVHPEAPVVRVDVNSPRFPMVKRVKVINESLDLMDGWI
jgi:hypothetical protein